MKFDWDDAKSEKLKNDAERGLSFEEAKHLFAGRFFEDQKSDDPEQYFAIGFAMGRLITIVFEWRESATGEEICWLITYWRATRRERELYEKNV